MIDESKVNVADEVPPPANQREKDEQATPPEPAAGEPAAGAMDAAVTIPAESLKAVDVIKVTGGTPELVAIESPIEPTVGRVVLYRPRGDQGPGKGQPYPATITHVWGRNCVNLSLCNDGSFPLPFAQSNTCVTSVTFAESADGPAPGCWCWMPFQKGQAAKTEDLSGAINARINAIETHLRETTAFGKGG